MTETEKLLRENKELRERLEEAEQQLIVLRFGFVTDILDVVTDEVRARLDKEREQK